LLEIGESFKHDQFVVDSDQKFKFPRMKETTQYPRSLASNATTNNATGSTLDQSVGALSALSAEDNQPM